MRRALTGIVSLALLTGTVSAAGAHAAETPERTAGAASTPKAADIKSRILAIPGMKFISEEKVDKHRFFTLSYAQPVDHKDPGKGTFQQQFTLLHKSTSRPTVFHTSGYFLWPNPWRSEPAQIIDGNEVDLEHRFFKPSRPQPADWSKLTIRQAADDQHRLFTALKKIYTKKWISTGASKGGMTATYYERFHPKDMDGVVAYVAPNEADNADDSAYNRFFTKVGTKKCRDLLKGMQREGLVRRAPMERLLSRQVAENGWTFDSVGSLEKAYEAAVLGLPWVFWQYSGTEQCDAIPADPSKLSHRKLFAALNDLSSLAGASDQGLEDFVPYYYQAGTELGAPVLDVPSHLKDLARYGDLPPRSYVPRDIPMTFKPKAMADVDRWVQDKANRMLFVNGQWDPWGAKPFRLGKGAKDSHVLVAPKMNHGADISMLSKKERELATAKIQKWAGVAPASVLKDASKAKPLAAYNSRLDNRDAQRERMLPPMAP
ncbi:S28 family serine protease [Streptomyces katsurahamanus]|uniref:Aminopeptidase n=1 Tax=Streptomyces katsurahamanus TaxID=2577098 RepID=A0ABW9NQH5_9ACTN|nr:S28 family serine protease [Streptomyces katsurahamanus]MQS35441.1 aminopeptidase [Streptomyces katsurahamanus]